MSWSITIARIAGSEIRIHLTFLLLLAWIGIAQYSAGGADAAIDSIVFVIAVFACVVLHELGHVVRVILDAGLGEPGIGFCARIAVVKTEGRRVAIPAPATEHL